MYHTSKRFYGELAFIPIVQHVALCNHHIHTPQMGPYIMPELAPLNGSAEDVEVEDLETFFTHFGERAATKGSKDSLTSTKEALARNIQMGKPVIAEQNCLWLLERLTKGEVLDLILPSAISRNNKDDHFFLYPMFTARALDCIGWQWAYVLMRPVVRYQCRNPFDVYFGRKFDFSVVEETARKYRLLEIDISASSSPEETEAIGKLAASIGACRDYFESVEMLAEALAHGLSLEGAGEALSIGAATIYLSTNLASPLDSHLHTGANARRYLLNMEGVSLRNKLLALLTGITGPECTLSEERIAWSPRPDSETLAALPKLGQDALLDTIINSIEQQPWADWGSDDLDGVEAGPHVQEIMALAYQYADRHYDPMAFFTRLGELVCRDDYTETHSLKHHQATIDEFYSTRQPFRWMHLVSAAKWAAVVHGGREQTVYDQTRELLKV